ncbi:GntR family transcriptional regulator [Roseomonas sp. AR75]|uniref:GntR family transcriptional regulator n=1 Tax=Roseomonas sp. AR75 TaxID=2562311 RepID=UPI0010BF8406|nr:GntR family transcriptional regulator [Roseomonas sp. AR75]
MDDLTSLTVTEAATRRLRQDIIAGDLAPATRLRLRDLVERYGFGTTPLREALSRLVAEGLVHVEGQKGFSVPPVTREHLLDITGTRQVVEVEAFSLAMQAGGAAWEDEIVASLSLLRREVERREPGSMAWHDAYELKHHRFHQALISACPLAALRDVCEELYDQTTRYRRVMKTALADWTRAVAVHQELADAALARDVAAGRAALHAHIGSTARIVAPALFGPDGDASN